MAEMYGSDAIREYLLSDPMDSLDTPLEVEQELEGVDRFLREFGALSLADGPASADELDFEPAAEDPTIAAVELLEMSVPADVQNLLEGFEKLFVELDPPEEPDGAFVLVGPDNDLDRGGSGGPGRVPSLV